MKKLFILFGSVLILACSVFAQEEAVEEVAAPEETAAQTVFADEGVVTGEVLSLDAIAGTIIVKLEGGEKKFSVIDGETILWRGIEDIELGDVKQGEEAEVGYYTNDSGDLIASWVDVLIEEETVSLEIGAEGKEDAVPQE